MTLRLRWLAAAVSLCTAWACSSTTGGGCSGFTSKPQGSYTGLKMDSAGALRVSSGGFTELNANSAAILEQFAPGSQLVVPVSCSVQNVNIAGFPLAQLTFGDEGSMGCTAESCGQLDGRCDAKDEARNVTITVHSLTFAPKSPDIVEARINASVVTGPINISSPSRSSVLCLLSGGGPVKCSVDFDTARAGPTTNDLSIQIQLAIDTKWDRLLNLTVSDIGGAKACGSAGASPAPQCIDPADILIAATGTSCQSLCNAGNFSVIKQVLVDQLTKSLKDTLDSSVKKANCAVCSGTQICPSSAQATAMCVYEDDAGTCVDSVTGVCVPKLLGVEGTLNVGSALARFGAPEQAAIDVSLAAGGASSADSSGVSIGLRGGAQTITIADCVKPAQRPTPQNLPLPNFDLDAPSTPYDVAVSVSQQMLAEALFQAQQSGALCLELGQETIAQLDSSLLATVLPSVSKLTHGESVPMRVVIRPVNPPTVTVGQGTFDANGKLQDPLLVLSWKGLEVDLYALLEDRQVRLFTLSADLSLPLGLEADCDGLTPVVGSLLTAVTNVDVKNNELLAEPLDALKRLVPTLLTLAEPAVAAGLPTVPVPMPAGLPVGVKLISARGVGVVSGTSQYNHLGMYGQFYEADAGCPMSFSSHHHRDTRMTRRVGAQVGLELEPGQYSFRVDRGFWSIPSPAKNGSLTVEHPRLLLGGSHVIELRGADGSQARIDVP